MRRLRGTVEDGAGAFVQLRDEGGDFVGEVRADDDGSFAFYTTPGRWLVVCLMPGERREQQIDIGEDDIHVLVPA